MAMSALEGRPVELPQRKTPRSRGQAEPHDFCFGGTPSYCLRPHSAMMLPEEATTGGASWPLQSSRYSPWHIYLWSWGSYGGWRSLLLSTGSFHPYGQKTQNQLCGRIDNPALDLCSANLWWALVSFQSWISTSAPALAPLFLPGYFGAPQDQLSMDDSRHGPRPRHGGDAERCRWHGSEERYPTS
jgi:hypothetical protein